MSLSISSWSSNSISTLFSSLGNSSSSGSTMSSLYSSIGDYNTIRSGSYYKLMNAYYSKNLDSDTASKLISTDTVDAKTGTSTSTKSTTQMKAIAADASDLNSAATKLTSSSMYGTSTDSKAVYDAVENYVDSYNDMVDNGTSTTSAGVNTSIRAMETATSSNKTALGKIGITAQSDGTLKLDRTALKASSTADIKSLFSGSGSYGKTMASLAETAQSYANGSLTKNSYTSAGTYGTDTASSYSIYT